MPLDAGRVSAALLSACVLASHACAGETQSLRIVTFNAEILTAPSVRAGQLQKFRFNIGRQRQHERVADLIEVLAPDILNLVEVTSEEAVDLLVELLHEKGLEEYRGYHVEGHDSYTGMDVALVARLEPDLVDGKRIRSYYSAADDPQWRQAFSIESRTGNRRQYSSSLQRNAAYFFTIAGHKLGFLGLHLRANPSNDYANAYRMAEAEVVRRVVRGEIVGRDYLPIVLGDLNDYDASIEDRDDTRDTMTNVLASIKDYDSTRPGDELVNVAERITRIADRYTSHWDLNENGARDPEDVLTMIDHILLPSELMPHVRRAFIAHVVALENSDHFPVVVDLELPVEGDAP